MLLLTIASVALHSAGLKVDPRAAEQYLRFLASAQSEGRMTLSPGSERAAKYIADQFKAAGLKPMADAPGYLWPFEVTANYRATKNNMVVLQSGTERLTLTPGNGMAPLVGSPTRMVSGQLVFVGYGVSDGTRDDYAGLDVKEKIVVAFRGMPAGASAASNSAKARAAKQRGAAAILFVGPSGSDRPDLPKLIRSQGLPPNLDIVAAAISERTFNRLTDLEFSKARANTGMQSKPLEATAKIVTETERNTGKAYDVVGVLPGTDPALKNETIIIGAHYDHVGYAEVGSRTGNEQVHFGADDNASGTSGVISLAYALAKRGQNKRTIIFQTYSGEELGLLGSNAWAKGHPSELKNVTAMLNLDMIGRLRDEKLYVYGTSTAQDWTQVLEAVNEPGAKIIASPNVRFDSDQAAFAMQQVPILFFHTGLHEEYHTEKDSPDTINFNGIALVAEAVGQVVDQLDARPKLRWNPNAEMGNRRSDRDTPAPARGGGTQPIRVGFIPDMAAGGSGVVLSGASDGSPAAKAGFKPGDRIVEFGGKKIDTLEDLAAALSAGKPGVKTKVAFIRDGQRMEVDVVPEVARE